MFTWAYLSPQAERKYLTGGILDPNDWQSGNKLWIIDLIAPYPGLTAQIARWAMVPGNVTTEDFRFRRVVGEKVAKKIVHIDFRTPDGKADIMTAEDYIASL